MRSLLLLRSLLRPRSLAITLAFTSALLGCNELAGIHEPVDPPPDPAPFLGTWHGTTSSTVVTCNGEVTGTGDEPSDFTFKKGPGSGVDLEAADNNCHFRFAITSARVASFLPSQCDVPGTFADTGDPFTLSFQVASGNFTVAADGQSAHDEFSGGAAYVLDDGSRLSSCQFKQTDSYTKAP